MRISCLTDIQKSIITDQIQKKIWNQTQAAKYFKVHRRTIQRVLIDAGMLTYKVRGPKKKEVPVQPAPVIEQGTDSQNLIKQKIEENKAIISEVRLRGLNPQSLKEVLDTPALTPGNVHLYLMNLPTKDLAQMFFIITMAKQQRRMEATKNQEAANA
jgi:hypothetical protein